jgi:ribosomal protein S18 acetylase RimI-like enzyme
MQKRKNRTIMRQSTLSHWIKGYQDQSAVKRPADAPDGVSRNNIDADPGCTSNNNKNKSLGKSAKLQTSPLEGTHKDLSTKPNLETKFLTTSNRHLSRIGIRCIPCPMHRIVDVSRLNDLLLPIKYPPSFYQKLVNTENSAFFAIIALYSEEIKSLSTLTSLTRPDSVIKQDKAVGAITGRILNDELYILTLCTLSSFSGMGIATALIATLEFEGIKQHDVLHTSAHVWKGSPEIANWYVRRGFEIEQDIADFFHKLTPPSAFLMRRRILRHSRILHVSSGGYSESAAI